MYFGLAAVCVSVCVLMPFPFSAHSNPQNRKHGEKHLASSRFIVVAHIGAQGGHVCMSVCGRIKGVALHEFVLCVFG